MIKVRIGDSVVSLPTLKGVNGKSAYQYAKEAGFEGTEQDFINLLVNNTDIINTHLDDKTAHPDIRVLINTLQETVDSISVDVAVATHNLSNNTHSDIRELISALQEQVDNIEIGSGEGTGSGDASEAIQEHNTSSSSHNDIRELITELTNRLNALADSDDDTLDQLSEIVTYIKANKELIESVTTTKVNVSDIINNLESESSDKPLSAAQGKVLSGMIDTLQDRIDNIGNIGGDDGDSSAAVTIHNTSTTAHSDIRELITELATRLNALADSDDVTLDQLSEIVAYVKANKSLIDSITTSKINVSDIANDLTTNSSDKVLSAAQGVVIKETIDTLQNKVNDIEKNNEEALSEYMKKSESPVTAIDSNTVTFSNGLTISHNPETGEVNFSFN